MEVFRAWTRDQRVNPFDGDGWFPMELSPYLNNNSLLFVSDIRHAQRHAKVASKTQNLCKAKSSQKNNRKTSFSTQKRTTDGVKETPSATTATDARKRKNTEIATDETTERNDLSKCLFVPACYYK